jgi:hypothetical protein
VLYRLALFRALFSRFLPKPVKPCKSKSKCNVGRSKKHTYKKEERRKLIMKKKEFMLLFFQLLCVIHLLYPIVFTMKNTLFIYESIFLIKMTYWYYVNLSPTLSFHCLKCWYYCHYCIVVRELKELKRSPKINHSWRECQREVENDDHLLIFNFPNETINDRFDHKSNSHFPLGSHFFAFLAQYQADRDRQPTSKRSRQTLTWRQTINFEWWS